MHGAGWSRITHPFATLTPAQAPGIPFDLHVLSTPPAFILSQNRTLHKKPCEDIRTMTPNIIDGTVYKENDPHKTPTPITGPSATPNKGAGIGLAIKMTLQSSTNTLLSSQTTTARPTRTTPAGRPAPTGSKGITYTNPATNANPTQPNTPKTLETQHHHRRVANTQKPRRNHQQRPSQPPGTAQKPSSTAPHRRVVPTSTPAIVHRHLGAHHATSRTCCPMETTDDAHPQIVVSL